MPIPDTSFPSADIIALWYQEAEAARGAGQADRASHLLAQILAHDPEHAGALHSSGLIALAAQHVEAAQAFATRAINARPEPAFYHLLCVSQIKLLAFESAIHTARQGLLFDPQWVAMQYLLGVALQAVGQIDEAATIYRNLLELQPDHAYAVANLGTVEKSLGLLKEAEHHLRRAMALQPANAGARANLSQVLLAQGRYEEAWPLFEDRWVNFVTADGRPDPHRPDLGIPQWRGETVPPGTRLLVVPEQGHGDSLQFVRYLPLALRHFSKVGYICPESLRRLYDESFAAYLPGLAMLDNIYPNPGEWDLFCPLMSMPMAFGTRVDNIPAFDYLQANAARADAWAAKFSTIEGPRLPRVGVVWAGGHSGLAEDRVRSLTFAQIVPLLATPGIHWISLQKAEDSGKRADMSFNVRLYDWMHDATDFADTAALIANLDLVISVDTSVAHLAAAMGKQVWLLNRFAGCWRWLRDRDDSPWYRGVRLFTQTTRGNWNEVLERVAAALEREFTSGRCS